MEGTLYSRFEVVETLTVSPGLFADEAYRARESATDGSLTRPRTVMMRSIAPHADTRKVYDAIIRASRLAPHPSILATLGVIEAPEEPGQRPTPFLISEYARGMLLSERISRLAPFSLKTALDIGIAISEGLAFADAAGLDTHDVRPEDIVCTTDGDIKIADIEVGQSIRTADHPVMTYVSGAACIGGLIYEMLTGKSILASNEPQLLAPNAAPESLRRLVDSAMSGSHTSINELTSELRSIRSEMLNATPVRGRGLSNQSLPLSTLVRPQSDSPSSSKLAQVKAQPQTNNPPEIAEPERGKTYPSVAVKSSPNVGTDTVVAAAVLPGKDQRRSGNFDEYSDENEEEKPRMNWLAIVGRGLQVLIALTIIGFVWFVVKDLSNVPQDVTVTSLIGQQFDDASQKQEQAHIHVVQIGHTYSDTWPQGAIYQQDPLPGRMIKADKDVDVWVSDGPRLTPVPDLSQMTLGRAQNTLSDSGLPIGTVKYNFDDTTPKGIVTSQSPAPGANISRLTNVNLTVSKGPAPPSPPTDLSATCTVLGEIDLAWSGGLTSQTYDVYRDGKKIASEIPESTYSDVGLTNSSVHVYAITAVNSNGESQKSASASSSDNPDSATNGGDTANANGIGDPGAAIPTPAPVVPSESAAPGAPKERQFHVKFRVPNTGTSHKVQIDIQDTTGTTEVYDEEIYGGNEVEKTFQAFGNRVILRIFIDGKLVKQQPK